ncbi:hypothetical protein OZN62_04660 [Aurantiacibacter sp. MUD11]|uniref:hypothetical protein n=1 Tax=Aurantiacibacter sp. MUD11 TaxID=3003265 RepID=UPI0022AA7798|nr:hypothetical protein [Aurantiacibacter sp. MUD11]WAT18866.1 hypothetical protein OZN62_04660 [Aurantiacibacter sp. MUD11]
MYSEQDLRDAVAGGAITEEAARALRAHVAQVRRMPVTDEENFRLINSFNDIFVTIAAVLLLVAMAGIGNAIVSGLAGLLVAGAAWMMSEFFTRRRRMALPSIVLLLAFVGGIVAAPIEILSQTSFDENERLMGALVTGAFVAGAIGAWVHWKRFMVPITIAALAATAVAATIALIVTAIGPAMVTPDTVILPMVFVAGLAVFAFAMRWDISDRTRETRRSDVAFWLHLLAAPMIAHPLFHWLGITEGDVVGIGGVLLVLAVYVVFGLVALAVDRRALLVSALAYVLFALTSLFEDYGMVELSVALTALVIGSALLMLSAFWPGIRAVVVDKLPSDLREKLPVVGPIAHAA